jgi:hypothetical protein
MKIFKLFALCLVMLLGSHAAGATLSRCCLDEWQGGGVCPAGYRLSSYCSGGTWACENCGTFTCVPESTRCFQ